MTNFLKSLPMKLPGTLAPWIAMLASTPLLGGEIPTSTPAEAGFSAAKLSGVDSFLEKQIADQKLSGGMVLIARDGNLVYQVCKGLRDIESKQPITPETIFRLYSMTKSVTSAAALILVDEGKLKLDDPVSLYLPKFADLKVATSEGLRAPRRPITVKDLFLHTAGMTYGSGPDATKEAYNRLKPLESTTLSDFEERVSRIPLAFDPGTDWLYSVSIDALGRVIEVASGQPLDQFLKVRLFDPLGMKDTGFSVPPEKKGRFAAVYSRSETGLKNADPQNKMPFDKKVTFFSGGGGLVGTGSDYLRFLLMIEGKGQWEGKRYLKPETVSLMTTNQLSGPAFPIRFGKEFRQGTGFGLGFSVRTEIKDWDPAGRVGEYGWGGAASTHYWVSPRDRLVVVTLEQILPYQWDTEFGIKKTIYDALER